MDSFFASHHGEEIVTSALPASSKAKASPDRTQSSCPTVSKSNTAPVITTSAGVPITPYPRRNVRASKPQRNPDSNPPAAAPLPERDRAATTSKVQPETTTAASDPLSRTFSQNAPNSLKRSLQRTQTSPSEPPRPPTPTSSKPKKEEKVLVLNTVTKRLSYASVSSLSIILEKQIQKVPIPKFKEHLDVYLKDEQGEESFFVRVRLPDKVQFERLVGRWKELHVVTSVEGKGWNFA